MIHKKKPVWLDKHIEQMQTVHKRVVKKRLEKEKNQKQKKGRRK